MEQLVIVSLYLIYWPLRATKDFTEVGSSKQSEMFLGGEYTSTATKSLRKFSIE
jgi:hypothetical protein